MIARYMAVFDETLCVTDGIELSTCDRAPADNSPHRHFTVFQMEVSEGGSINECGVTRGLHNKEVVKITEEAVKKGIYCYSPQNIQERVNDQSKVARVTLKRESEQTDPAKFYIDLRDDKGGLQKALANYADTAYGYQQARRELLSQASRWNLPYKDYVEEAVLKKD